MLRDDATIHEDVTSTVAKEEYGKIDFIAAVIISGITAA